MASSEGVLLPRAVDATSVLTALVAMLVIVPAAQTLPSLGAAGAPALLFGAALLAWWAAAKVSPVMNTPRGFQPVWVAIAVISVSILASYIAAMHRVTTVTELNAADRGVLFLMAVAGIALVAADGIESRERLHALLRGIVWFGTLLSLMSIVEFVAGWQASEAILIPGLQPNAPVGAAEGRYVFDRVYATTTHPIELSVVLAMMLPLAISLALTARSVRRSLASWTAVALMVGAISMTLSRSGVLAAAAGLAVLVLGWRGRRRLIVLLILPVAAVILRLLFPGLVGTIRGLFLNVSSDRSIQLRLDDYEYSLGLVRESPLVGRGFKTMLPEIYDWIDNQILVSLVETGLLGLLALLATFAIGILTALGARRRFVRTADRDAALGVSAALTASAVSLTVFDALSFHVYSVLTFLLIGCAGALWRLSQNGSVTRPTTLVRGLTRSALVDRQPTDEGRLSQR